jgi:pimeloyl-ACP methyl ester carboxylesterase
VALFVLVHGVCAGGWSWNLVTPYLEAAGHSTLAVDLPGDDPAAKFSDYAEVILRALPDRADIVLVGHSTGGLTIPIVAARRPVDELVFLCGAIPVPGESVVERGVEWRAIDPAEWQVDNGDGSFAISPEGFRKHVAPDAPAEVIQETIPLLRPQFLTPFLDRCPIDRMPDVPTRSIFCSDDRIVGPDYSRAAARDLLGVEPEELPGSHSPMGSRPGALAETLLASRGLR